MSVMWIGEERLAVGLLWQRGHVEGRAARRAAREVGASWMVDVAGQTGFLDDEGGPGGTKPLAGVLSVLLRGRSDGSETWIAFVEEDGKEGSERRVAVVRCVGGLLPADGDAVFASAQAAAEAVDPARLENALIAVTPGLAEVFPGAMRIESEAVAEAFGEVELLAAVRSGGISRKQAVWTGVFAGVAAAILWGWSEREAIGIRLGLAEKKEERPRVSVEIASNRFLAHCRDEIGRRELGLVGFDRIAVLCHAQYKIGKKVGAPKKLDGRPVLEVRWQLRKPLPPRVYVGLAETRLAPWYWAGVHDDGNAVGIMPLPQILMLSRGVKRSRHPVFRQRVDGLLALRGFRIEYTAQKKVEVVLETERPLEEAVALVSAIEGLEVVSVAFAEGRWRFEARRLRAQSMFQDKFEKVTAPLAQGRPVNGDKRERVAS